MRRSRLYLTLSIVSLLVAVGIGVAQKRCGYFKHQHACPFKEDDSGTACEPAAKADVAVWEAFDARDFDDMATQATILLDREDQIEGRRLRAYALRGQRRYEKAEAAYTDAMSYGPPQDSEATGYTRWRHLSVQCEAHIGRAICRYQLRNATGAKRDINAALTFGRMLTRDWGDESDHYLLACAYAVQAEMLQGEEAGNARLRAIGQFQRAIELGFNDWQHARADLDLDSLRGEPVFLALFPKP
jgi:tetratricopeptide (TPR) repeat protein